MSGNTVCDYELIEYLLGLNGSACVNDIVINFGIGKTQAREKLKELVNVGSVKIVGRNHTGFRYQGVFPEKKETKPEDPATEELKPPMPLPLKIRLAIERFLKQENVESTFILTGENDNLYLVRIDDLVYQLEGSNGWQVSLGGEVLGQYDSHVGACACVATTVAHKIRIKNDIYKRLSSPAHLNTDDINIRMTHDRYWIEAIIKGDNTVRYTIVRLSNDFWRVERNNGDTVGVYNTLAQACWGLSRDTSVPEVDTPIPEPTQSNRLPEVIKAHILRDDRVRKVWEQIRKADLYYCDVVDGDYIVRLMSEHFLIWNNGGFTGASVADVDHILDYLDGLVPYLDPIQEETEEGYEFSSDKWSNRLEALRAEAAKRETGLFSHRRKSPESSTNSTHFSVSDMALYFSTGTHPVTSYQVVKIVLALGWYDRVNEEDKQSVFRTFPGISVNCVFDSRTEEVDTKEDFQQNYPRFTQGAAMVIRSLLIDAPYRGGKRTTVASPRCNRYLYADQFKAWYRQVSVTGNLADIVIKHW